MVARYCHVLCWFVLAQAVSASVSPAIEDALEEHLKDVAHKEGAETLKHDTRKGEKIHDVENKLKDIHQNQIAKSTDDGTFLQKEKEHKAASESDAYKGHTAQQDKAEDSESSGFKRGHKKGHHKQGFQNSYHKDESSNKSTFFDDLSDEGDQAQYNSRLASHDNYGGRNYQGSHNNGQEYVKDNHRAGGYNRHNDYGLKNAQHHDYGRKHYSDDDALYNKHRNGYDAYDRNKYHDRRQHYYPPPPAPHPPPPPPPPPPPVHNTGWDWQRWENSRAGWDRPGGWERDPGWQADPGWREAGWRDRDYAGPGYYDDRGLHRDGGYGRGPYHGYGYGYDESRNTPVAEVPKDAPVVAHRQQTITIYEDPRYNGKEKGQLRKDEGDYVQLDFKPSSQRYAKYDDTYYASTPARSRQRSEASNINRLVYNYKRQ